MQALVRLASMAAIAALLPVAPAQAALVNISNAAYAATYTRDCRSAGARAAGSTTPNLCEANDSFPGITRVDNQYAASLGGFVASASSLSPLSTQAGRPTSSYVDASGPAGELILKQFTTTSTGYARASGHSMALQSFQWTGADGERRAVAGTLDFTAAHLVAPSGSTVGDLSPRSFAQTSIRVFSLSSASFDFDADSIRPAGVPWSSLPQFADAASARADFQWEAGNALDDVSDVAATFNPATGRYETSWNYEFTAHTGRYYFVESWLGLWSVFGATIDASHTFITQLGVNQHDSNGNVSGFTASTADFEAAGASPDAVVLTNAVPEPATLALVLLAFATTAGATRRRR